MPTKTIDEILASAADRRRELFIDEVNDLRIDSPIERALAAGFMVALVGAGLGPSHVWHVLPDHNFEHISINRKGCNVYPQIVIGQYRVDFLVDLQWRDGNSRVTAVMECDGHDFHEKTKEQATRDKERERYLQSLGLIILRYSGSEIWRDPVAAAEDALSILWKRLRLAQKASA